MPGWKIYYDKWQISWWIIEIEMNTLRMENEISEHCDQKDAWETKMNNYLEDEKNIV